MTRRRPNVVIFLSDDLGYSDIECFGSKQHQTPNLNRMAAEGLRFTDFHANGPMCSPTRAALLTGKYQQRCGVEFVLSPTSGKDRQMSPDVVNFGRTFTEAGYATGFFGKYHTGVLPDYSPLKLGFQAFAGISGGMDHNSRYNRWGALSWYVGEEAVVESGYSTDLITRYGIEFMKEHQDEPFLLYLADWCVHFPWQGPADPVDFDLGVDSSIGDKKFGRQYPNQHKRAYKEMVEAQDRNVGRVIDTLMALGLADDTLFIFTSDNGGHHLVTDNTPLRGAKGDMFEGGHRVPAIMWWPNTIKPGQVSSEVLMTMDIFPTIVSLAGIESETLSFDGVDCLNHIVSGEKVPERHLFWRMGDKAAARRGDWKYLTHDGEEFLFNSADDRAEQTNQIDTQAAIANELKASYAQWVVDVDQVCI